MPANAFSDMEGRPGSLSRQKSWKAIGKVSAAPRLERKEETPHLFQPLRADQISELEGFQHHNAYPNNL